MSKEILTTLYSNEILNSFDLYIQNLFKWNKIHNLTAMKTIDEVYDAIYDSIYPINEFDYNSILDIGSGAGFPALFWGIVNPQKITYLVEPNKKKAGFLNFIKSELNLTNIKILNNRVEQITMNHINNGVDIITSRAVTDTNMLLSISKHLYKQGTKALFYKGSNIEKEIKNIKYFKKKYKIINRGVRNYLIILL